KYETNFIFLITKCSKHYDFEGFCFSALGGSAFGGEFSAFSHSNLFPSSFCELRRTGRISDFPPRADLPMERRVSNLPAF
ncbi:MAG: hypothetical protein Q8O57_03845, partial [Kiritimatiellota bacterium]|nr:hypothetical protein [Kiritimatiellota bacterium]